MLTYTLKAGRVTNLIKRVNLSLFMYQYINKVHTKIYKLNSKKSFDPLKRKVKNKEFSKDSFTQKPC